MAQESFQHLVDSIMEVYSQSNDTQPMNQTDETMQFLLVFAVVLPIIVWIYLSIRNFRIKRTWESGIIPNSYSPTEDHIFEVFLAAGAMMIALDGKQNAQAFRYIKIYLSNRFPNEYYDLRDSYRYSLKHVLKINSLVNWCNKYLNSSRKIQLINFLAGVALFSQGFISDIEKKYLLTLLSKLHLQYEDLEPRFRKSMEESLINRPKYSIISMHYRVLGIPDTVTLEELKKAYRELVKQTHPDRFVHESKEIQRMKKEEFQRIQESYEFIIKQRG